MDAIKSFKKYLNEQDIPDFSESDKEILEFIKDRLDMLDDKSSSDSFEVVAATFNQDYFIDDGDTAEGLRFLKTLGNGWETISNIIDRSGDYGSTDYLIEKIANKEWDAVARLYSLFRAEELMLSSEVLGQKQDRGEEELDASDIEDLRDELTIFID
tara:strand:- start:1019 stop:1489 length:471 start_codon:yes stop_codon:yes gene_type:complete